MNFNWQALRRRNETPAEQVGATPEHTADERRPIVIENLALIGREEPHRIDLGTVVEGTDMVVSLYSKGEAPLTPAERAAMRWRPNAVVRFTSLGEGEFAAREVVALDHGTIETGGRVWLGGRTLRGEFKTTATYETPLVAVPDLAHLAVMREVASSTDEHYRGDIIGGIALDGVPIFDKEMPHPPQDHPVQW